MADNQLRNRSSEPDEEAFDEQLSRALHSVSIPSGLKDSLVEHIRQSASNESARLTAVEPVPADEFAVIPSYEVQGTQPQDSVVARHTDSKTPASGSFRRPGWGRWLVVVSVSAAALLLLALFVRNQPVNVQELSQSCLAVLEQLDTGEAAWLTGARPDFSKMLDPFRPAQSSRVDGYQVLEPVRFGSGKVWKLSSNRGPFYVFEFRATVRVKGLGRILRVIDRQSGGWSLAACAQDGRIVVVAVRGDIDLAPPSLARTRSGPPAAKKISWI